MTLIDKAEALRIVMEECYKDREMKLATRIEERIAALPARGVGVKPPLSIRDWVAPDHDYRPSMDPDDQGDCAECGNSASWHNPPALAPTDAAHESIRCAECDCANGGDECTWIKTTTDAAQAREAAAEAMAALSWAKANLQALSCRAGNEGAEFPIVDRALASLRLALIKEPSE